ncbi:hypothetical protein GT755_26155 [Herbidospora sp. NEAU-GS84]|uniref:Polysaccharide chain length determinant N-terminal domain-containing protein n=1 Tax=Herbidospora solisilvae TaxID=2696284 RepID=A0A7C9N5E7_9ACTN|nr:hypothetical protein [Herbidospora solisilvae]NAS25154.1 hypothetical protein [Herbidospora solisilvae]
MATDQRDETPEVGLLEAVWRYRWSSLALILVAAVAAGAATFFVFGNVEATARFAVVDPRSTTYLRMGVSSDSSYIAYTAQRAAFAQSAGVLDRARQLLENEQKVVVDLETLRQSVTASPGTAGGIVVVTATAKTDKLAAQMANSVVAAYQILTEADAQREQEKLLKSVRSTRTRVQDDLKRAPDGSATESSLTEALVQLQLKESEATIDLAQFGGGVRFVDQANPLKITPSKVPTNIAIGLAVGALLAIVIAFLRATNPIGTIREVTTPTGQRHKPAQSRRPVPSRPEINGTAPVKAEYDDRPTAAFERISLPAKTPEPATPAIEKAPAEKPAPPPIRSWPEPPPTKAPAKTPAKTPASRKPAPTTPADPPDDDAEPVVTIDTGAAS